MAENKKPAPKKKRATTYDNKLEIKGSFLDIIKASVKHADNNSPKPKS
jgi:hypothetical protein